MELSIERASNNGIVRLIETQNKLFNIHFIDSNNHEGSFYKVIENSLIKHANTIHHFKILNNLPQKFFYLL